DALTLSVSGANVYDNIAIDGLLGDTTVTQGSSIPISTRFEDKSNGGGTRDATITLGFDRDDNPYDGVYGSGVTFLTSSLGSDTLNTSIPTTGIAGGFHIYAKISNGVTTRYYYAPGRAIVTLPGTTRTWIG